MAKGQMKATREKRKPKAEGGKKNKVPAYMSGGGMSAAKPEPLKINPKK